MLKIDKALNLFKLLEEEKIDSVTVERTENARVYSVKIGGILKKYRLT